MSSTDKEVKNNEAKPDEVKPDEVKPEVKKEKHEMNVKETLINHLDSLRKNEDIKKDVSTLMLQITGDESHMEKIEKLFNRIIEDKKINISDVGDIVLLLEELYVIYNKSKVDCKVLSETLKTIFSLLLSYRLDKSDKLTEEEKEEILKTLDSLLSMCIELMDFKESQKSLKSIFRFFGCGSVN
jgi:hypothetical protein